MNVSLEESGFEISLMNTKRENIRDGRLIVFMFSFMTDKTKLILALMHDRWSQSLNRFRTKRQPSISEWASCCFAKYPTLVSPDYKVNSSPLISDPIQP